MRAINSISLQIRTAEQHALIKSMSECYQTEGVTILEHGLQVAEKFNELISGNMEEWRLPEWFISNKDWLISNLPSSEVLQQYQVFHDCGKVKCLVVDEDGKRHFPNHAMVSAREWLIAGGSQEVANLIERDMDMHLLKPSQASEYKRLDLVPALLLTALSEIHANAQMFGGIESVSFKIKFKQLSKRGNAFIKIIKE